MKLLMSSESLESADVLILSAVEIAYLRGIPKVCRDCIFGGRRFKEKLDTSLGVRMIVRCVNMSFDGSLTTCGIVCKIWHPI